MTLKSLIALACALTAAAGAHAADQLHAPMTLVSADGTGKMIGSVTITESSGGLVFTPNLTSLPPGAHGFHVHETGSCGTNEKDGKRVAAARLRPSSAWGAVSTRVGIRPALLNRR